MHEWSLAMAVVQAVDAWARERGVRVGRVVLGIPSISMLELDVLREAFDMLKRESALEGAALEVRVRTPRFRCRRCGLEFGEGDVGGQLRELRERYGEEYPLHLMPDLAPTLVRCPRCGSHDIEVDARIAVEAVETA